MDYSGNSPLLRLAAGVVQVIRNVYKKPRLQTIFYLDLMMLPRPNVGAA